MRPPQILETRRLRLRPPTVDDARAIFESYAQDPEVTRYLDWRPHADVGETETFLRRCEAAWADGSAFPWVIERMTDDRLLGMIEMRVDGTRADFGYVLAREHWGRGYVPEAVAALRDWTLAQPGIHRFWAVCDVDNRASQRVLEKAGLQREGVLRRWGVHTVDDTTPRDCACYAIVKERMRRATPDDAARLSELVLTSKRHWGYPEDMIELWRDDLTITPELIERCTVIVAERDGVPVGVSAVSVKEDGAELEHLWIHPSAMGTGLGRRLFDRSVEIAMAAGAASLLVVSDPNAEGFYVRMGAKRVGAVPSRPEGRRLPALRLDLTTIPGRRAAKEGSSP